MAIGTIYAEAGEVRIAFVTTCRGRVGHLRLTLPQNLRDRSDRNSVFVVLDYNDLDGLGSYIEREHKADLDSGALVYYRTTEPTRFHMAHAKNLAHRCGLLEGANVLVNLDADNWTGPSFAEYVDNKFTMAHDDQEAIFLGTRANHRGPGDLVKVKTPPGCFGRIAVTADAFRHSGGYDEVFNGWSPDDKDFASRLSNLGYNWRQIRVPFLRAIKHGTGLRFKDYRPSEFDEAETLQKRADKRVVNAGQIGVGNVHRNFSTEYIQVKPIPTRIFGVGLHKTGTTSLEHAFRILGFDSAHWESPHWAKYIWQEMKETGYSRTLEMHYALCDLPIPLLYKELDQAYPGSKFILTVRDENDWIDSIRTHWRALRVGWDNDVFSNEIHKELYGTTEFDEKVFRARYRRHNSEVVDYFRGRDNFLVVHMSEDAQMGPMCRFLGLPTMGRKFPHKHKSIEQVKYSCDV